MPATIKTVVYSAHLANDSSLDNVTREQWRDLESRIARAIRQDFPGDEVSVEIQHNVWGHGAGTKACLDRNDTRSESEIAEQAGTRVEAVVDAWLLEYAGL